MENFINDFLEEKMDLEGLLEIKGGIQKEDEKAGCNVAGSGCMVAGSGNMVTDSGSMI